MRTHRLPLTALFTALGALSGCTGIFHSDAPALQKIRFEAAKPALNQK